MGYSFDIRNSRDLFEEFRKRAEEYQSDPMSSGNAVICAILAWHLVEWVHQEYEEFSERFPKKREFQSHLKKRCVSLSYIQDIANGSKHRGISKYQPSVRNTTSHKGAFSPAFSKGFDVPSLRINLNGGFVYFDEELEKVTEFFSEIFENLS